MTQSHGKEAKTYRKHYITVFMPEGEEACKYCPCIKYDNDSNTRRCKLTWEMLPYFDISVGRNCMLINEPKEG
ncbi:MAG: hypothetical protein J5706_04640 [Elusimicrobiales bacterium]|nr:hypothetical protein [Elusimicrobiales bacterium]